MFLYRNWNSSKQKTHQSSFFQTFVAKAKCSNFMNSMFLFKFLHMSYSLKSSYMQCSNRVTCFARLLLLKIQFDEKFSRISRIVSRIKLQNCRNSKLSHIFSFLTTECVPCRRGVCGFPDVFFRVRINIFTLLPIFSAWFLNFVSRSILKN